MPKSAPRPVFIDEHCFPQMTWDRSIKEQTVRVEKNNLYGHELPYVCGDEVTTFDGQVGVLVHKEFLYRDTPNGPGHDVWMLNVQFKAALRTYSNPTSLVKSKDRGTPAVITKPAI